MRGRLCSLPKGFPDPIDFDDLSGRIFQSVRAFTATSPERVYALVEAVKYVTRGGIDGALVECGVWKGGSVMAMTLTLKELGDEEREIYLYDTFSGMAPPSDSDISYRGKPAKPTFCTSRISDETSQWYLSPIEDVSNNVLSTGYPKEKFHFAKGKVKTRFPELCLRRLHC